MNYNFHNNMVYIIIYNNIQHIIHLVSIYDKLLVYSVNVTKQ